MFTREELKKWQDGMLEQAKEILLREGYHAPIAILLTSKDLVTQTEDQGLHGLRITEIDAWEKTIGLPEEEREKAKADLPAPSFKGIPSDAPVFITLPLVLSPKEQVMSLLEILRDQKAFPPEKIAEAVGLLKVFEEVGKRAGFSKEKTEIHIRNAFFQLFNTCEKDLQAYLLKRAICMTGAYAYCKIDEMWLKKEMKRRQDYVLTQQKKEQEEERQKAIKSLSKGISDDPDRIEGIGVALEAVDYSRLLFVPFTREGGRDTNTKITAFGEPDIMEQEEDSENKMTGRFCDLLKKAAQMRPPKAQA